MTKMTNNRTTRIWSVASLLLALTLMVGACGESLTDTNANPNEPTSVPGEAILPNGIVDLANNMTDSFWELSLFSTWSQQLAKIQYDDEDVYAVRADALQPFWDGYYNVGRDFQEIIDAAQENGNDAGEGIGRVLKSFTFHLIVDAWGPAPYSEAYKLEEGNTTPAYDSDAAIYDALLSSLATADGLLAGATGSYGGQNDLIYGGDLAKWRKFANSLRLMLAVRMGNASQASSAVSAGTFQSNADNATLHYLSSSPNRNPIYVNGLSRDDQRPSETMLSYMRDLNDPRIGIYAKPALSSSESDPMDVRFAGEFNGTNGARSSFSEIARIGGFWRDNPDAPFHFMTYAQVLFYKAEAAHTGMISGGDAAAQQYYEDGIQAAMDLYDVPQSEVDAYMAQDGVAWGTDDPMKLIGIQKWLGTYMGDALDVYAEIRRLGYPEIEPGPDAQPVNGGHPPTRILYPPYEQTLNGSSYQGGVSMLGADNMSSTIFWDMNGDVP